MVNADIRRKVFEAEISYKEVAAALGVTHEHLCRLLASELTEKNRERVLEAIEQVKMSRTA